ncbi:hypothetical protein BC826DRAFT_1107323 [Russula brevipes]|nr:hypothetical protein BC826DRAFT_1107323 [Russula brevipes]
MSRARGGSECDGVQVMNATGRAHAGADLDDGWLVERVAGEAATYLDEDEVARAHLEGAEPASMTQLEGAEPPGLLDDEIVWLAEVEATVEIAGVEEDMGPCLAERPQLVDDGGA